MKSDDLLARIKQHLKQLVESKSLTEPEMVQVINAVAELTENPVPTKLQRVKIILGLMRESDLWQIAYDRKMHQLKLRLRPHQLEIVRKVIVQGVLGKDCS